MHDAAPDLHYTMKAASRAAPTGSSHGYTQAYSNFAASSHAHPHSQSSNCHRSNKGGNSTTPMASPRGPYSVGQHHPPKSSPNRGADNRPSSPNYFGLVVDSTNSPQESSGPGRNAWSPPTSSVKSFGAAIQTQVPLEANPDFEAFRKQIDLNKANTFALGGNHGNGALTPNPVFKRPRPSRWHTHASDIGSEMSVTRPTSYAPQPQKMDVDHDTASHDSAYVSADSKRTSESSSLFLPPALTSQPRFESPGPMSGGSQPRTNLTRAEDRDPRLSLMEHKMGPPSPSMGGKARAATLPHNGAEGSGPAMIQGDELKDMMKSMPEDHLLILDIRSAQNYAASRIKGALNLCIPTTLLKRATFNIQKLQQTFQSGHGSAKFANWRKMSAIVVYDSHSSDQKDAVTAQNMIKKFTNEGYTGKTVILKGGFMRFKETHPKLVDSELQKGDATQSSRAGGGMAPVIGGVSLPMGTGSTNPFFSNIRQNMDLADGVGQFQVSRPEGLDSTQLPLWLRRASAQSDKGKMVSEKFLNIEKAEKARMQTAYAAFDPHTAQQRKTVQLCGVEKGGKNRYKDILPFEHARVRLHKESQSCDYVNASHIKSSMSNKRYIASQGPLPATFEDFWSVVWDQDVRVIVMLTAESEGGQLKCHSYWQERAYGSIRLKPLSEKKASLDMDKYRSESSASPASGTMGDISRRRANTVTSMHAPATSPTTSGSQASQPEAPHVVIRKFALSHTAHPFAPIREITQLHFSSWPDFGTPAQPSHLLALVELANVMQRAALPVETPSVVGNPRSSDHLPVSWHDQPEADDNSRPMLVHCSAGCGRTGTFCTVDSVIDMLKRQRLVKGSMTTAQDADGDVAMAEGDDVSPRTNKQMTFAHSRTSSSSQRKPSMGASTIETSWLRDESVDLIQKAVEGFRQQRLSMVQSLRQYVLCYETVLEWTHRMNDKGIATPSVGRARSGSMGMAQPRR